MKNPDPWTSYTQALRKGEEGEIRREFQELYKSVREDMVRFARSCTRQHNRELIPEHALEPEDVVEELFTMLFLNRQRAWRNPRAWVLASIKTKLRWNASRTRREFKAGTMKALLDKSPDDLYEERENGKAASSVPRLRRHAIRRAWMSLPNRMRTVIFALYYQELSVSATATQMGVTENAVVQTKLRALRKLQQLLG